MSTLARHIGRLPGRRRGRRRPGRRHRDGAARADPGPASAAGSRASSPPFHADWATARPLAPYHKGDGHITDDTLMTHALVRAYAAKRDHLDAYDVADCWCRDLIERVVCIPDLEREAVTFHRLAPAERWLVTRLHHAHADPREAGSATSSTAARPCTWRRSASSTRRPGRRVRRGDRDRRRAPAQLRPGGGRRVRGRGRGGDGARRERRRRRRRRPGAGPRRHPRGDRRGGQGGPRLRRLAGRRIRPLRAAVAPYDTVGRGVPQPGPGRAAAQPAARDRGAAGGARHARGRPAATSAARCWARSTTAGTPTPPPRWPAPSPARSAAPRGAGRVVRRGRRPARTDLVEPARVLAAVAGEVFASATGPGSPAGRTFRRLAEDRCHPGGWGAGRQSAR